MPDLLIQQVRRVPIDARWDSDSPDEVVDVAITGERVSAIGPDLPSRDAAEVIAGGGRWLMPGLWDAHVHFTLWAQSRSRLDLRDAANPEAVLVQVATAVSTARSGQLIIGQGYRLARWSRPVTVAELDAVTGAHPVALISADAHNGWLNTAALQLIGIGGADGPAGPLMERDWFEAYRRLDALTGDPHDEVADAIDDANRRGVVGIVDFEFESAWRAWPSRLEAGLTGLRVRASAYPHDLDAIEQLGYRTGEPLVPGQDLVTMGALKVITDGSLGTLTAACVEPYGDGTCGVHSCSGAELVALLTQARSLGLSAAVHAIGDAAVSDALDAFARSRQVGTIEHAQLIAHADLARLTDLGLTASVQPSHAIDDRDLTDRWWADRAERAYAFRDLVDAGVPLALGSDAPVATLDPWASLAAAVHRSDDGRPPWHPEQSLTVAEALGASVDGAGTVSPGSLADVILLDADPYAGAATGDSAGLADWLRAMSVSATIVAGAPVSR